MNLVQMLSGEICSTEMLSILAIVKTVLNIICIGVPIILIVLIVLDLAKIVTAGNIDDKLKKEVTNKIVTRIIFAVLMFLVPTIVRLVFNIIPLPGDTGAGASGEDATWKTCWDNARVSL